MGASDGMFCPNCDSENKDTAKFCHECGIRLNRQEPEPLPAPAEYIQEQVRWPDRLSTILRALAVIGIILLIMFLLFNSLNHKSAPGPTTTIITTTTVLQNPIADDLLPGDVVYTTNTVLTGNVITNGNVVILKGVTVTTDGQSIIVGGTFNNSGTLDAGNPMDNVGIGVNGISYTYSYGGSGGSGGGGNHANGTGGYNVYPPKITNALIKAWYSEGMEKYLTGGGGGGACHQGGFAGNGGSTLALGGVQKYPVGRQPCTAEGGSGAGSGSYGVYIQANLIIAGSINANGQQAPKGTLDSGGGGGGGVILMAYSNNNYIPGTYNVSGGSAQGDGGAGGKGIVVAYSFGSTPPIGT